MSKPLAGSYSALAAVGIALFFLPWVRMSCKDVTWFSQSGYEVAAGKVTKNPDFEKELAKKLGVPEGGKAGPMGDGGAGGNENAEKKIKDVDKFPVLFLYPAGLLFVVVFGLVSLTGPSRKPLLPLLGAAVTVVAIVISYSTDFPFEKKLDMGGNSPEEKQQAEMVKDFLKIERTGVFTVAALASFGVLALVLAHFILSGTSSESTMPSPEEETGQPQTE